MKKKILAKIPKTFGYIFEPTKLSIAENKKETINKKIATAFIHFFLILFSLAFSNLLSAQQKIITGRVNGVNNTPLDGTSVTVKGKSNIGTTTDMKGIFSIPASSNDTLVFEFIGYQKQEIRVGNNTQLNVVLTGFATNLNEVIVVGYGTQSKKIWFRMSLK